MEILLLSFAAQPGRAMSTMDGLGTEIFGAIQGNQHVASEPAESVQAARHPFQRRNRIGKHRMKSFRLGRIEHVANMIVAGNLGDREQARAVRASMPKLEPPLMRKKRRALHEKHRERRHPDVAHSIGRIDPATLVRKAIQASSQRTEEGFKGPHPLTESDSRRFENPLSARRVKPPHPGSPTPPPQLQLRFIRTENCWSWMNPLGNREIEEVRIRDANLRLMM
jgi:hypothetical protein